jgi:hypothetical protein
MLFALQSTAPELEAGGNRLISGLLLSDFTHMEKIRIYH